MGANLTEYMDYSTEPIDSEDLRAFVNKALECLRSSQYKDFEKSVKLIALCQEVDSIMPLHMDML